MRDSYLGETQDEHDQQANLVAKAKAIFGLFGVKKEQSK